MTLRKTWYFGPRERPTGARTAPENFEISEPLRFKHTGPAPEKPKNIALGRSSIWSQGQGERFTQSNNKLDDPRVKNTRIFRNETGRYSSIKGNEIGRCFPIF